MPHFRSGALLVASLLTLAPGAAVPVAQEAHTRPLDPALGASLHGDPGSEAPKAPAPATADAEGGVPEGLAASEWSSIREAYEAARHAAFAVDGGHRARNPGQQWATHFDGRGFTTTPDAGAWTWGLELQRCGFAGGERTVTKPTAVRAEGQRVSYDWGDGLTEWYVNDGRGLEHGYTVRTRPGDGTGPLTLDLAIRGGLAPAVSEDGRAVRFIDIGGASVLTYTGLTVVDADDQSLPARFDRVAGGLRLLLDDAGARYPITIDPIAQQAYLKASNTGAGDRFGFSVSASGNTVVIGASFEDSNATGVNGDQLNNGSTDSGAAYVFVRSGGAWSQQAYLKASNTQSTDEFGRSVSVSGDTIVIGARNEDSDSTGVNGDQSNNATQNSGAAYVFVRSGTTWSQQAYLKASTVGPGFNFGDAVAVSGDTIVVGSHGEDSNATGVNGDQSDLSAGDSGAAYVFVRSGSTWTQQAYLKASNTGALDWFGLAVAASGDTVVVSAYQEDSDGSSEFHNGNVNAGAAYVFARNGTAWSQQAYLKGIDTNLANGTMGGDLFGFSVAASGDTVVVGAFLEDSSATGVNGDQGLEGAAGSGAAFVFVRSGTTWSQQAYLKSASSEAGDTFGASVAISGDTVVVGGYGEDSNATGVDGNQLDNSAANSGAAYVFTRIGAIWSQVAYLKASNSATNDNFGGSVDFAPTCVSVSGDTVVVGANLEDSNATGVNGNQGNDGAANAGAAYVFDLGTGCGVSSFGTGTPGCSGSQNVGVSTCPLAGTPSFAFTCDNAPPNSLGLLLVGDAQDLAGSDPFGIGVLLHVDLLASIELISLDLFSDPSGLATTVPFAIPAAVVGNTYYAMALWAWASCSLPPYNLSTSRGLSLTILVP